MGTAKNEFFRLPRKPANAHFIRVFGDAEKFFCTYLTQSDELGRVVIPKEIRRTLRIREGDPQQTALEGDAQDDAQMLLALLAGVIEQRKKYA